MMHKFGTLISIPEQHKLELSVDRNKIYYTDGKRYTDDQIDSSIYKFTCSYDTKTTKIYALDVCYIKYSNMDWCILYKDQLYTLHRSGSLPFGPLIGAAANMYDMTILIHNGEVLLWRNLGMNVHTRYPHLYYTIDKEVCILRPCRHQMNVSSAKFWTAALNKCPVCFSILSPFSYVIPKG